MAMLLALWLSMAATLCAQQPNVHYLHHGIMPPGAIGSRQLQRGGPLPGFYQPVEIKTPAGALISLAAADQFDAPRSGPRKAGLLIGAVYRLRVTSIRLAEGLEVFPTIEVIDRLYAPAGQERRFAIPIELTEDDLRLALAGKFVTRVIYLEDPRDALPVRESSAGHAWFEAAPGQDPLAVADGLGRPVAILRLGGRLPDQNGDAQFFFGSPPFADYPPERVAPNPPAQEPVPAPAPKKQATVSQVRNLPPPMPPATETARSNSRVLPLGEVLTDGDPSRGARP